MIKMLNKIKKNTFVIKETKYMLDKNIIFKRKNMKLKNHLVTLSNTMEMREKRVSDPEVKKRSISIPIYLYQD